MHDLPWLPKPPADYNTRCSKISECPSIVDEALFLANCTLTINQANRLVRELGKLPDNLQTELLNKFTIFRLGIVSNATMDLFIPSMIVSALRRGIMLEVITADFGQIAQEALDSNSKLNRSKLDAVLLALDYRAYSFSANALTMTNSHHDGADALAFLRRIRDAFFENSGVTCITQTLASPPVSLTGSYDIQKKGMIRKEIMDFNSGLVDDINNSADVLLDVNAIANLVGECNWFDERQWYMSRVPIANRYMPLYSDHLCRRIAALRGKNKKCLVVDLDNTLWAGVIGDDGLNGIQIGQGNPIGESYLTIQRFVAELKNLGVILAVCSKNDEEIACQPFNEHPDMLLKKSDFAVFVANWEDKASNIRAIASALNIGLDSIVFVDDNPVEREIVRTFVPDVSVPELPDDASQIPRILSAAGYFEIINFTTDDAIRNIQYSQNMAREKAMQNADGIDAYLESLEMKITFSSFDEMSRKRVVQLINKTNQFNLTTKRYTEAEVKVFEQSNNIVTLQARLTDRFGDNGMISILICKEVDNCWEIDTWLMSCRVIKRRVEESVCNKLMEMARHKGIKLVRGIYRQTDKNGLVKEHYMKLGFFSTSKSEDQEVWEIIVDKYQEKTPPISVI